MEMNTEQDQYQYHIYNVSISILILLGRKSCILLTYFLGQVAGSDVLYGLGGHRLHSFLNVLYGFRFKLFC